MERNLVPFQRIKMAFHLSQEKFRQLGLYAASPGLYDYDEAKRLYTEYQLVKKKRNAHLGEAVTEPNLARRIRDRRKIR